MDLWALEPSQVLHWASNSKKVKGVSLIGGAFTRACCTAADLDCSWSWVAAAFLAYPLLAFCCLSWHSIQTPFVSLQCVWQVIFSTLQSYSRDHRLLRGTCTVWPWFGQRDARALNASAGKPVCVIAAVTFAMDPPRFKHCLFRCYGHAPWYKVVTHLGSVSTLLTPPRASGPRWCKSLHLSV